jgi:hypothetical protein
VSDSPKQSHRLRVGLVACVLLAAGCATTSVQSHGDPTALRTYQKLMVFVKLKDLGLRQAAEQEFQKSLAGRQTQIVSSLDVFLPGQTRTKEASHQALNDAGIDAVLVITPAGHGVPTEYIPETTTVYEHRNGSSTEVTTGGYEQEGQPWANYNASLHDRVSHKVVWVAQMSSEGIAFAQWADLVKSMAKKTSERLLQDRIVQ